MLFPPPWFFPLDPLFRGAPFNRIITRGENPSRGNQHGCILFLWRRPVGAATTSPLSAPLDPPARGKGQAVNGSGRSDPHTFPAFLGLGSSRCCAPHLRNRITTCCCGHSQHLVILQIKGNPLKPVSLCRNFITPSARAPGVIKFRHSPFSPTRNTAPLRNGPLLRAAIITRFAFSNPNSRWGFEKQNVFHFLITAHRSCYARKTFQRSS